MAILRNPIVTRPRVAKDNREIWYVYARKGTKKIDEGHWFFHPGPWIASGGLDIGHDGKWILDYGYEPFGSSFPEKTSFATRLEALQAMADFHRAVVRQISVGDLPSGDQL